ncbi:MAG: transcriptional repressor [Firmicutes bacterium]|nr:transcriptional repressor [Bacillota bacterium]
MTKKVFQRNTKQREVILSVLREADCHPTADWIYQEVRKTMPNVSLGTIYRNLKALTEAGLALELSYGSTYSRFDGNPETHYHFVCEDCGKVVDLEIDVAKELEEKVAKGIGAKVHDHRLEFYGVCSECLQKESKVN